jgi:ATP-dependent DNA helicase RecQ
MDAHEQSIQQILKKYWGFDFFRPQQSEIIQNVLEGKDGFALLPTGGGKSICYQVPAIANEGVAIIISPLIALMKDQVQNLKSKGIVAEAIYSGMHSKEIDRILDNCVYGNIKMLYLSPERLQTDLAIERLKKMNVSLLAVDEAHCISQWGHDFRPAYLDIAQIRQYHPNVPMIALTATATKLVRKEIVEKLELHEPSLFVGSFSRNNLNYLVFRTENKTGKMLHILNQTSGSAILYVRNRRKTKELADWLMRHGISAQAYHGGMKMEERSAVQDSWLQNKTRVMVATNAFGMGIDKPDVRTVLHYEAPPSLEDYYQEAGRAGRDGKTGYCVLLFHKSDIERQIELNEQRFPSMPEIRRVYKALQLKTQIVPGSGKGTTIPFDIVDFCAQYDLPVNKTFHALRILEQDGWFLISESVYMSSRVHFKVTKAQVYDYQLRNKDLEPTVKLLLRAYEGLFTEFSRIDEGRIANRLNTDRNAVVDQLKRLAKDEIIEYKESSEKPQLTFLRNRVEDQNLSIDQVRYKNRKDRIYQQLQKTIHYLDHDFCRENFLLEYFGEHKAESCGHCDLCRKRSKQQIPNQDELVSKIPADGITIEALLNQFTAIHEKHIQKLLHYMEGEKVIRVEYDRIFLNQEKK